jgi:hypothetical protein
MRNLKIKNKYDFIKIKTVRNYEVDWHHSTMHIERGLETVKIYSSFLDTKRLSQWMISTTIQGKMDWHGICLYYIME